MKKLKIEVLISLQSNFKIMNKTLTTAIVIAFCVMPALLAAQLSLEFKTLNCEIDVTSNNDTRYTSPSLKVYADIVNNSDTVVVLSDADYAMQHIGIVSSHPFFNDYVYTLSHTKHSRACCCIISSVHTYEIPPHGRISLGPLYYSPHYIIVHGLTLRSPNSNPYSGQNYIFFDFAKSAGAMRLFMVMEDGEILFSDLPEKVTMNGVDVDKANTDCAGLAFLENDNSIMLDYLAENKLIYGDEFVYTLMRKYCTILVANSRNTARLSFPKEKAEARIKSKRQGDA